MHKSLAVLAVAAGAAFAPAAQAQTPPDTTSMMLELPDRMAPMIAAGLLGGAIGFFVGGSLGAGLERASVSSCSDFCGLAGFLFGGVIGETLGMAAGVHLGDDRLGSFGAAFVGPALVGGAGLLLLLGGAGGDESVGVALFLVGVPTVQLITAIAGERRAARRKLETRR